MKSTKAYCAAIIVCAGNARRMGGIDKLTAPLAGIPAAVRSIRAFNALDEVGEIIVVCRAGQTAEYQRMVEEYHLDKVSSIVAGGETRQSSVFRGVRAVSDSWKLLAVHDGARPLVSREVIVRCMENALKYGAAAAAVPVKDTVKRAAPDGTVAETPDRSTLYAVQTPQIFDMLLYCSAMDMALENGMDYTDDCQLAEAARARVFLSPGDYGNLKITTREDFSLAELLLAEQEENPSSLPEAEPPSDGIPADAQSSASPKAAGLRAGHGYDVHKLDPNRRLILGGVEIPYEKGLLGHSDADVLLHAVMDALLGAAALGDIGEHFPDTDQDYAGADSALLLARVGEMLKERGFQVCNIDATVIAQAPKLKPYIPRMRENIARALSVDPETISVKATTEEGLGLQEPKGIAAHAVCMLSKSGENKGTNFRSSAYLVVT